MRSFRKVEVQLSREEWFDVRAQVDGSNQRAKAGWFRMEVRTVEGWEFFNDRIDDQLTAIGRRYKPDGTLSEVRAIARVAPSQLPETVRLAVNQMTDAFR